MFPSTRLIVALLALFILAGGRLVAQTGQPSLPASFTAFAVSPGGARSSAVASQVEITIDRWSTAAESQRLMTVLKDKGPEKLVDRRSR